MTGPKQLSAVLENLKPGDHLCSIYETEAEQRAIVTPFIRAGLERGEKVFYVVDAHTPAEIRAYVNSGDTPSVPLTGLSLLSPEESYLREAEGFDPQRMIAWLKELTAQALDEGYTAVRITGEMTWALRDEPGVGRLMEYEARLNDFFHNHPAIGLCQYDRRRFSPSLLLEVLQTHPLAVVGTEVLQNFYYIPPEEFLGEDPEVAILENWFDNLRHHHEIHASLRREVAENAAIATLSQALVSSAPLHDIALLMLEQAQQLTESTLGYIGYLDPVNEELVCPSVAGERWARCQVGQSFCIFQCLPGLWAWGLEHQDPLLSNDVAHDARLEPMLEQPAAIRRLLAVPLLIEGRLMGQLALANSGRAYTERDVSVVQRLASLCALAIERRRREEVLHRERDLLHQIMETSPLAITVVDAAGQITFANSPAEAILGLTRAEIVQRTYNTPEWKITDEEGAAFPDDELPFRRVQQEGEAVYGVEHAIVWPDDRWVLLSISAAPLWDEEGSFAGMVSIIEDITERRERERERIRRLEQELRDVEALVHTTSAPVTAQLFGNQPLHDALPQTFEGLVIRYEALLERALERRLYKGEEGNSRKLRELAEALGQLQGSPRDLVQIHALALRRKTQGIPLPKAQLYAEEGRLTALELMGYLASFYRARASISSTFPPGSQATASKEGETDVI